jgi:hypothetical protein
MTRQFPGSITFVVLVAIFLVAAGASTACAQSATASTQPPQAPASQPASGQTSQTPQAPQAPQKKVWTNENLGGSHSSNDSAAQPAWNSGSGESSGAPARPRSRKDAKWYRDQIAKLQAQLPPLDKSIVQLQAALEGKTLNEPLHYGGNRIGDWKEQLQQLQAKRQDIAEKITALEDEARHNGVATNALP